MTLFAHLPTRLDRILRVLSRIYGAQSSRAHTNYAVEYTETFVSYLRHAARESEGPSRIRAATERTGASGIGEKSCLIFIGVGVGGVRGDGGKR